MVCRSLHHNTEGRFSYFKLFNSTSAEMQQLSIRYDVFTNEHSLQTERLTNMSQTLLLSRAPNN